MKSKALIGLVLGVGLAASAVVAGPLPKPISKPQLKLNKGLMVKAVTPLRSVAVERLKRAAKRRARKMSVAQKAVKMKIPAVQVGDPFSLTPRQPYHARYGHLESVNMNLIASVDAMTSTGRSENTVVSVKLRGLSASRRYLAECLLGSNGARAIIMLMPSRQLTTQTMRSGQQSNVAVVFSGTQRELLVSARDGVWSFQGCTITPQR